MWLFSSIPLLFFLKSDERKPDGYGNEIDVELAENCDRTGYQ